MEDREPESPIRRIGGLVALKRILIAAFPASMSAAVSNTLK